MVKVINRQDINLVYPINMIKLRMRFYEELNDFLPLEKKKVAFEHAVTEKSSIKDVIESLGVPHTEVDLILVNQQSVNFNYQIQEGDNVSVYPVFESFNISNVTRLRPKPLRVMRFILDVHLGKLAKYLRLLGFDVAYDNQLLDEVIVSRSNEENRIVLTRDVGLLKHKKITRGYWVRQTNSGYQVKEVLNRFDLYQLSKPFSRCIECNGLLETVNKDEVAQSLPPLTIKYYVNFVRCKQCKRIYWEGTHYLRLSKRIKEFLSP